MDALFNNADCLVGPGSYAVTQAATTASVAPGAMYLAATQTVVSYYIPTTLNFAGQSPGTYYIAVSVAGVPAISSTLVAGTIYSVMWAGAFVGQPVRIAACLDDAAEADCLAVQHGGRT